MDSLTPREEMSFTERMQQNKIESDPNTIYADSLREEKVRNVISQLNPELLLSEIEHRIRGEKKRYSGDICIGWEPIDYKSKPVSELLVQRYISFLNAYLTQNNSLSNYKEEEINNIMQVVIDYIRDDLTDNSIEYGLTTKRMIKIKVVNYELVPETITYQKEYFEDVKLSLKQKLVNFFLWTYYPAKVKKIKDISITHMKQIPIIVEEEIAIGEEITDYNEFTRIGHIVCQSTFSVLKQAQDGILSKRIFGALRVNEQTNNGGMKPSKLDVLKFW